MIHYKLSSAQPTAHLFNVELIIPAADPQGQKVCLPNWIPGSYLIRDYARHVITMHAYQRDTLSALSIEKIDSNTWQCEQTQGSILLKYTVYAWDLSVRGAHLDECHAFINPCAVLVQVCGQEDSQCLLSLIPPNCPNALQWKVATTLPVHNALKWGFGDYTADSYDDLIDHPIEMGTFEIVEFEVAKVKHYIAVTGIHDGCLNRLAADVSKICQWQIELFDNAPPFKEYLFLLTVLKEGYGGLEHRSCAAMICQREALPLSKDINMNRSYINLLALFSHEYLHAWHVKRIKPAAFMPYNLNQKNYTEQLWAFEGITSYYDELALLKAKLISFEQYLDLLAIAITRLLRNPGRTKQTLLQASFDAWIKFYQPNENSVNALVSYYLKGSLLALLIDLNLIAQTSGENRLDNVMRKLWHEYGKKNIGVPEGRIETILEEEGGASMKQLLKQALSTTEDLPLALMLQTFGLKLTLRAALNSEDMGGKRPQQEKDLLNFKPGYFGFTISKNLNKIIVSQVFTGSAAMQAGIWAQDEIVAINDLRIDPDSYEKISKRLKQDQQIKIHIFRQDILLEKTLTLQSPPLDTAQITVMETLTESQKQLLAYFQA
ncbi:MAG: M61 family metallopeptidase [Proteobacteria bacterium]|nr:M61 family metallopeptidase [Pseudomonadota bacterium]